MGDGGRGTCTRRGRRGSPAEQGQRGEADPRKGPGPSPHSRKDGDRGPPRPGGGPGACPRGDCPFPVYLFTFPQPGPLEAQGPGAPSAASLRTRCSLLGRRGRPRLANPLGSSMLSLRVCAMHVLMNLLFSLSPVFCGPNLRPQQRTSEGRGKLSHSRLQK